MVDDPAPAGAGSEIWGDERMAQTMEQQAARLRPGKKWVYLFSEGNATMRDLLGGKGAGCAEMTNAGLPGSARLYHYHRGLQRILCRGDKLPAGLWDQVRASLQTVEEKTGKRFGDAANPLLVSVRSGAKFSMPGMMDTVLNLGLNDRGDGRAGQADRQRALRVRCLSALRADCSARSCLG